MDYSGKNGGTIKEMSYVGAGLVYVAYLALLFPCLILVLAGHVGKIEGEIIAGAGALLMFIGIVVSVLALFLIAPILQIVGACSFWSQTFPKKTKMEKRKMIWLRIATCGAYLLNALAFVFSYLLCTRFS